MTPILRTETGFHLFTVVEKRAIPARPLAEVLGRQPEDPPEGGELD